MSFNFLRTLRVRFALWTASLLLAALTLFGLFVYAYMSRSLTSTLDDSLHSAATQLIDEGMRDGLLVLDDLTEDPQYVRFNQQGLSVRLLRVDGEPLQNYGPYQTWSNVDTLVQNNNNNVSLSQSSKFETLIDQATQDPVRIFTTPIIEKEKFRGILQIALTQRNVQRTMNLLLVALLIGGPVIVFLAGSGGYFLAAQALNPIDKVTRTALQISAKNLSARLNLPATNDEVGRLVTTFDSMLARLDDGFRRERQFTADASHELRTPLAAMQTIIGGTLTRSRSSKEYEQALADLDDEVEQMRSLTEGLLILARNGANQQSARQEQVDLALLLKDVIDSLHPLAEDKGLQLIDKVPEDGLTLSGSRDGLIRLFVNLADNAIKYTKQGTITITAQRIADPFLQVTIQDTGIGIAPEHLPHIFDRFYRADSSRSTEGIGLGLAIASDIAHLHGGKVEVESEVGKGTTFVVTLAARA